MSEDLLIRIQRETHERLRELQGAVDEHDRLRGELRVLDTAPELSALEAVPERLMAPEAVTVPSVAPDRDAEPPAALEAAPELSVESEPCVAPERSTNVMRLPDRPRVPRTRMVSPKVARLMLAPRRPALERAGVARVGAGRVGSAPQDDPWPQDAGEEFDADVEAV